MQLMELMSAKVQVYRVCKKHNILQKANKPKDLTKQDKQAHKSDDLLQGDFEVDEPGVKYVTDITQIQAKDGSCIHLCIV